MTIRIVLAEDHRIVRDGLCAMLAREPDLEVVGLAEDGLGAIRLARELQPDVVVTDLTMPGLNGIEAVQRIRADNPGMRACFVCRFTTRATSCWPCWTLALRATC